MLSLNFIYDNYLESKGTKAYTINEATDLFSKFSILSIKTVLTHADLLKSKAGQRHNGFFLKFARIIFPRFLVKTFLKKHGLFMLITAEKK